MRSAMINRRHIRSIRRALLFALLSPIMFAIACVVSFKSAAAETAHVFANAPVYVEDVSQNTYGFRLIGTAIESSAYLRNFPDFSEQANGRIKKGETCDIICRSGDFYKVLINDEVKFVNFSAVSVKAERYIQYDKLYTMNYSNDGAEIVSHIVKNKAKLEAVGTIALETPVSSYSAFIFDIALNDVEIFARIESETSEISLAELVSALKCDRLKGGKKILYITAEDARGSCTVFKDDFYVMGEGNTPEHATDKCLFTYAGAFSKGYEFDYKNIRWKELNAGTRLTISIPNDVDAALLSLDWRLPPKSYTVEVSSAESEILNTITVSDGLYVDSISFDSSVKQISVIFSDDGSILDYIKIYEREQITEAVHRFEPVAEKVDLIVVSAHQDDEFLFYGGTIPCYAARDKSIAMVYMAYCARGRYREALNGLWASGLKTHPIFLGYYDKNTETLESAVRLWQHQEPERNMAALIRRLKPEVIVTHDFNGEYGHYQHVYTASLVAEAVKNAADANYDPASLELYGAWQTKKLYIHLYDENAVIMNWDAPFEENGWLSPAALAYISYDKHQSQNKAFSMEVHGVEYDNRAFGLYYSAVGADVLKNDFFENIE